jgi:hypothetical protein
MWICRNVILSIYVDYSVPFLVAIDSSNYISIFIFVFALPNLLNAASGSTTTICTPRLPPTHDHIRLDSDLHIILPKRHSSPPVAPFSAPTFLAFSLCPSAALLASSPCSSSALLSSFSFFLLSQCSNSLLSTASAIVRPDFRTSAAIIDMIVGARRYASSVMSESAIGACGGVGEDMASWLTSRIIEQHMESDQRCVYTAVFAPG